MRSHGITRDVELRTCKPPGPWYYEQLELGYNYRMTDLQAALGVSQLIRLEQFVEDRNALAERYDSLLTDSSFTVQKIPDDVQSSRHLYTVRVSADRRDAMCERLREAGIASSLHYLPVHLQPYYRKLGFSDGMFREAERYALEAITLPLFPQLTHAGQDEVIRVLSHCNAAAI